MFSPYKQFTTDIQRLLEHLEELYLVTHYDSHGGITYTNEKFLQVSKWTPKRVLDKTFWQMFFDDEKEQEQASEIWNELLEGRPWSGALKKATRSGKAYFVEMIAIPFLNEKDEVSSIMVFERDVTANIEIQKKLEQNALIDYETGLMNRQHLEISTNNLIANKESFTFVYFSIDHFYDLLDFQSNEARREMIVTFTNRLKRYFQETSIARIGVNEFVVLSQFGDWFIQGFNDFLQRHPIHIQDRPLTLSVSGGMIHYPEEQKNYTNLIKAALSAADHASLLGGGQISKLSSQTHAALNRQSVISRKLLRALEENKLQVVYQPQYDCVEKEIVLYEAFIRWEDEDLGKVSPEELIPIAEETGLIKDIGNFVLNRAANFAKTLQERGQQKTIAVNTSFREFLNDHRVNDIIEILEQNSCPAGCIQLEITETFAFQAEVEASIARQMQLLKDQGIEFALDDFGTGYASFRYMNTLPISKVKIDKDFIHSLTTHRQTRKLVNGMIQFAQSMDMYVIAEGVETEVQKNILEELHIDAIQGYFIGTPMTEAEILKKLAD